MTSPVIDLGHAAAPHAEPALLGEQTAGTLLRNIVRVYRQHFGVLMACSLLPVLPCMLLMRWLSARESPWMLVALLVYMMAAFLASGALTVVISDICLGNRPTVRRAYARILSQKRWWFILSTSVLLTLGMWLGLLLLVLPGLWLMARGLLTSVIVTLEGRKNIDAIKRSLAMTRGQAWRVTGLTLLPILLSYLLLVVCLIPVVIAAVMMGPESATTMYLLDAISYAFALALMVPVIGVTMVLLYYDQRVRREAYDVQALSEDLMR